MLPLPPFTSAAGPTPMNLSDPRTLAALLEAFLLAAGTPLSLARLAELFDDGERPSPALLRQALDELASSCHGRGFELHEVASGYRLQVRACFAPWVGRLWEERPQRYSRALLETLALVAYRQPVTRGEIEDIRGVSVNSQIIRTLQEREWIRVVGHREVPGRPALFATTPAFLDHFGLKSLEELPPLSEIRDLAPDLPAAGEPQAEAVPATGAETPASHSEDAEQQEQASFRSLLAELDRMEQGLKTDFSDPARNSPDNGDDERSGHPAG